MKLVAALLVPCAAWFALPAPANSRPWQGALIGVEAWRAGATPGSVVCVDLDGNGLVDFATVDVSALPVFLNGRCAGWSMSLSPLPSSSPLLRRSRAGDLDGDGKPEIVVPLGFQLIVLHNDGSGGFPTSSTYPSAGSAG